MKQSVTGDGTVRIKSAVRRSVEPGAKTNSRLQCGRRAQVIWSTRFCLSNCRVAATLLGANRDGLQVTGAAHYSRFPLALFSPPRSKGRPHSNGRRDSIPSPTVRSTARRSCWKDQRRQPPVPEGQPCHLASSQLTGARVTICAARFVGDCNRNCVTCQPRGLRPLLPRHIQRLQFGQPFQRPQVLDPRPAEVSSASSSGMRSR